jgi:RNA polymerase sigma-70 factor, ECF subfamily
MAVRRAATKAPSEFVDERVLVEAAQRDPASFGTLYEIHFERIYAFVIRRVRDREAAEDLTSEVFHKALSSLPKYEFRGAPFVSWLYRIAANAIADSAKSGRREISGREIDCEGHPSPDLEDIEQHARLFRLVDDLPGEQRRVVFARFVDEKSIREVAQDLGKTEGAIKQLQFRALTTLRKQMEGAHA